MFDLPEFHAVELQTIDKFNHHGFRISHHFLFIENW